MPPEEPPTALRAPSERSRWPPEATKTPRETSCGLLLWNLDGKMQRQMGAKTSGNFWHIILGHGHCGGVGAQRIEIKRKEKKGRGKKKRKRERIRVRESVLVRASDNEVAAMATTNSLLSFLNRRWLDSMSIKYLLLVTYHPMLTCVRRNATHITRMATSNEKDH